LRIDGVVAEEYGGFRPLFEGKEDSASLQLRREKFLGDWETLAETQERHATLLNSKTTAAIMGFLAAQAAARGSSGGRGIGAAAGVKDKGKDKGTGVAQRTGAAVLIQVQQETGRDREEEDRQRLVRQRQAEQAAARAKPKLKGRPPKEKGGAAKNQQQQHQQQQLEEGGEEAPQEEDGGEGTTGEGMEVVDEVDVENASFVFDPLAEERERRRELKRKVREDLQAEAKRMRNSRQYKEVPTGLICSGFSSSDHELFFRHLTKEIQKVHSRVATLKAVSCP